MMMMNKNELLASGQDLMKEFCEANTLELPSMTVVPGAEWRFRGTCAYYRKSVVTICPSACAHIGTGGMSWSYPGYAIDRTPYGVIQHELGHHVDFTLSEAKGAYYGDFSVKLRRAVDEPKLTNYCPNDAEWFAEMFRLFVTNSDLLRAMRPRTWEAVKERYKPVVDRPWREVLEKAPARTIEQAWKKATGT